MASLSGRELLVFRGMRPSVFELLRPAIVEGFRNGLGGAF